MRPLKLSFQAFGSYAEKASIDFEKLDSLFLIHGETGAGKTAILDAMMYALYGESSGGERSEPRCALPKAADIPTEAEFIFSVRGKTYKFTRSIKITPRSKKPDAKQDCFYYDEETGNFIPFFENPKQSFVKQKAEELTGLSAEQFRQVVILPQGRFERLLTSGSEEKEKILSTLFAAEKYTRLSEKLYEKADEERRELAAEGAALAAMLAAENADSPKKLEEEKEKLSGLLAELAPQLENSKKAFAAARERLTASELLSRSFAELSSAKERLSELDKQAEKISGYEKLLTLHEKALKAKPEFAALSEAKNTFRIRSDAFFTAEKNLSAAESVYKALEEKRGEVSALENTIAEKNGALTVLNGLADVYEKIDAAGNVLKNISEECSDQEISRTRTENSLKKTVKEISEAAAKRDMMISEFSEKLPGLRTEKAALENGAENAKKLHLYERELKKILDDIAGLSVQAEQYERKRSAAEAEYDRLYSGYISNAAAELSSRLKEGAPCPVCGSLSHPAPAEYHGSAVTAEEVKAARADFEAAVKTISGLKERIAAQKARVPAAEQYIAECRKAVEDVAFTPERLMSVTKECAEAERQNAALPGLGKWISSLETQKAAFENNLKAISARAEALASQKARAEAEISVLKERLSPECPDRASYTLKISALKDDIQRMTAKKRQADEKFSAAEKRRIECKAAFGQAKKERSAAEERLISCEKAFTAKLSELGGLSAENYAGALLPEKLAAQYSAEKEKYRLERHSAEETVKTLSRQLEGKTQPELEKLKAETDVAEKLCGELSRKEAVFAERYERLKKLSEEYSARRISYEKAAEKNDKRLAFARFMRGDKGISFTRYVLGLMLRIVTEEANRILADIHGGMFRLCVKTELAANSKQGLDLEVENLSASSSVKYGVRELSGGEKFLISLALSLGLSAAAQSRSGGVEIESMFIDEGFGSLDTDSLREAVGILCGLSRGRNTIGIISHVEELRNVVPCSIKITKSPENGSKIIM